VAFLGVFLGHQLDMPILDAISSLVIAVILMSVAAFLAYESRLLLLGEAADPEIVQSIESILAEEENVLQVFEPMTMHMGPNEILLNMGLCFQRGLSTKEIVNAIDRIEKRLQARHPQIKRIFLEAESLTPVEGDE
jgi:divalent metal cation (Fe/Co/Zn/Cd) transporter